LIESKKILPYEGEPDIGRLLSAFKLEAVDRVPNLEILIEEKHVEKLLGEYKGSTLGYRENIEEAAAFQGGRLEPMPPDDYIDLCNIIGQDAMIFEGAAQWTPFKKENSEGKLVQVLDRSIKTRADFKSLILDSDTQINHIVRHLKEYKKTIKKRNSKVGVSVLFGSLLTTLYEFVVGMNDFMIMLCDDKPFVEEMLEVSTEYFIKLSKAMVDTGIDFLFIADDVGFNTGLFIPPKLMKEIWVPRMARIIEPAREKRIPIMFHSDGKIDDIVEDLIDMGVNCINPLDPYGVDYTDYKARFGNHLCLSGNVDVEFPLSKGTPTDIENDVKKHMEVLKPGYGYVASCSHSIVNFIPHQNFIAYINSIHKYGKY